MKPKQSIRKYCLYMCSLGLKEEVKECTNRICPLWEYRLKRKPKEKSIP